MVKLAVANIIISIKIIFIFAINFTINYYYKIILDINYYLFSHKKNPNFYYFFYFNFVDYFITELIF